MSTRTDIVDRIEGDTASLSQEDRKRVTAALSNLPYGALIMHTFNGLETVADVAHILAAFGDVLQDHADSCSAKERQLHGLLGDVAALRRLFGLEGEGTVRPMGYGEGV